MNYALHKLLSVPAQREQWRLLRCRRYHCYCVRYLRTSVGSGRVPSKAEHETFLHNVTENRAYSFCLFTEDSPPVLVLLKRWLRGWSRKTSLIVRVPRLSLSAHAVSFQCTARAIRAKVTAANAISNVDDRVMSKLNLPETIKNIIINKLYFLNEGRLPHRQHV